MAEDTIGSNLVEALQNLGRGISSLLKTGSWKVEEYADQARDAETLIDRVDEAAEQEAQIMLDRVNDALVNWNRLNAKLEDAKNAETMWAGKAQSMADKARALPEGSPERLKLEGLIRQALAEQTRYADVAAELNKAVSESKPMYDESIKLLEQIGYTKDEILSQRQRLDIARANAETKKAFAEAKRGGGDFQAQKLLDEAREKVGEIQAKAEAADQIASHLPPDASQVDAEVASITRNDRVDEEFNKLMGNPQ